jgi:hypothetical protein
MVSLSVLTLLGLTLLKLSLTTLAPRQWLLQQVMTDAYMTYERAAAERIPFDDLLTPPLGSELLWPAFPTTDVKTVVIGTMPGGVAISGTVTRTRVPDTTNYPVDGGVGTTLTNPAAMRVWKVQSILTYRIGARNYAKSRTVLRSQ